MTLQLSPEPSTREVTDGEYEPVAEFTDIDTGEISLRLSWEQVDKLMQSDRDDLRNAGLSLGLLNDARNMLPNPRVV